MTGKPNKQAEIDELRATSSQTKRTVSPDLEEILYQRIPVLDEGFIRVIDYMGDDAAVVQAARVSYGRGTKRVSEDAGLINYLMRHRHTTPFEMCEIKYHVKLPIFVARQWIRHRTANVNEYSARYSILHDEFYIPDKKHLNFLEAVERTAKRDAKNGTLDMFGASDSPEIVQLAPQSTSNKQGREGELSDDEVADALKLIKEHGKKSYAAYLKLLNQRADGSSYNPKGRGLARELARMVLPTNIYTEWYWKIDLFNLMHFLSLRADAHAQYEIRVYAEAMLDTLKRWVPLTYDAFLRYRMGGVALSREGLAVVKRLIAGETVSREGTGLSAREWRELMETLGRAP